MMQVIDLSGDIEKLLITNKVIAGFFVSPFKLIYYALYACPDGFSRTMTG